MFKYATVKLSEIIVQALKQNQTMTDIEQTYYEARTCNEDSRRFCMYLPVFRHLCSIQCVSASTPSYQGLLCDCEILANLRLKL